MLGVYNQFDITSFISKTQDSRAPYQRLDLNYSIDNQPLCEVHEEKIKLFNTEDTEQRTYNLINQTKERLTKQQNVMDKLTKIFIKTEEKIETESEAESEVFQMNRYFTSEVANFENLTKGLCRRCKKPGHYEKWCVEDEVRDVPTCLFCLGEHHYRECGNNLCYKCNGYGHLGKECKSEGIKCHRCGKKGHKSKECTVIDIEDHEGTLFEEKNQLKKLKCINCMQRGHLNCSKLFHNLSSLEHDPLYYLKNTKHEQSGRYEKHQVENTKSFVPNNQDNYDKHNKHENRFDKFDRHNNGKYDRNNRDDRYDNYNKHHNDKHHHDKHYDKHHDKYNDRHQSNYNNDKYDKQKYHRNEYNRHDSYGAQHEDHTTSKLYIKQYPYQDEYLSKYIKAPQEHKQDKQSQRHQPKVQEDRNRKSNKVQIMQEKEDSVYSIWSDDSPGAKHKHNMKQRKISQKQRRRAQIAI